MKIGTKQKMEHFCQQKVSFKSRRLKKNIYSFIFYVNNEKMKYVFNKFNSFTFHFLNNFSFGISAFFEFSTNFRPFSKSTTPPN